ncbi:ExbD/TolR family protein [Aerophototrophica crusticola]|uniref:ExbD/TolR family protein n=1 Tax=Aerophototrophica crusticola TaxID=1709002 RepID=UPI00384F9544
MPVNNQPPPPTTEEPQVIKLDVDFDGTVYWNGEVIPNRQDMEFRMQNAAQQADPPEVHLRPNKLVEYKHVAAVLASAQRLGLNKIAMIGNEQFAD